MSEDSLGDLRFPGVAGSISILNDDDIGCSKSASEEIEMKEIEKMIATVYGKYIAGVTNTTANGRSCHLYQICAKPISYDRLHVPFQSTTASNPPHPCHIVSSPVCRMTDIGRIVVSHMQVAVALLDPRMGISITRHSGRYEIILLGVAKRLEVLTARTRLCRCG